MHGSCAIVVVSSTTAIAFFSTKRKIFIFTPWQMFNFSFYFGANFILCVCVNAQPVVVEE